MFSSLDYITARNSEVVAKVMFSQVFVILLHERGGGGGVNQRPGQNTPPPRGPRFHNTPLPWGPRSQHLPPSPGT